MRCPVCRAENDQGPQCRRCRADLALLFDLEKQREHALACAFDAAARGQWRRALLIAEGADTLRRGPDAQQLQAVLHLLGRHFGPAWLCYRGIWGGRNGAEGG